MNSRRIDEAPNNPAGDEKESVDVHRQLNASLVVDVSPAGGLVAETGEDLLDVDFPLWAEPFDCEPRPGDWVALPSLYAPARA